MAARPGEGVDELLTCRRRHRPGDRTHDGLAKSAVDGAEHVEEVREHDDLEAVLAGLLDDLGEPVELRRVGGVEGGLTHPHDVPGPDRRRVGGRVGRREPHPVLDLDLVRQFGEYVLLVAPQVDRRHSATEPPGAGEGVGGVQATGDVWSQVPDEVAELLDPVLHRRSGEEQRPLRPGDDHGDLLRALRLGILDVVGLVHHHHRDSRVGDAVEATEGVERGDRDTAGPQPAPGGRVPAVAVQAVAVEGGVLADLVDPVDLHTGRADHEETGLPVRRQVGHRGEGLDGLAEPHLVAEDRVPLVDRVLGAEHLVSPQGGLEQPGVQRNGGDLLAEFVGEEALSGF